MTQMSIAGYERVTTSWRRAAIVGLLYATVIAAATTLVFPNSAHAQSKPRVAVTAFENKAKGPFLDSSWKIGERLAEMLTTELTKTG